MSDSPIPPVVFSRDLWEKVLWILACAFSAGQGYEPHAVAKYADNAVIAYRIRHAGVA